MHSTQKKYYSSFSFLALLLITLVFINISTGSLSIPFKEIWNALFQSSKVDESYQYIITNYRLPKSITSILTGIGLGISGLLMQTYFRNPLAGPFVLGISSGASLGVALLIMGGSFLGILPYMNGLSIPIASSLGAFLVLSVVMITARNIRNTMSILIIGLMFGSFTSAIISILSYFSSASELQQYIFWSFGSLSNLQWNEIYLLCSLIFISCLSLLTIIKPLDALLLGENYAKSLGISLKKTQNTVFIITSLLTGSITAFVGPIAFIGLAIPHITKLVFKTSNHKTLLPAVAIIGAIVMLICDTLSHISLGNKNLPINAITSLFGAPVVIWLLVSKSKKTA
ncbi:FecCD family ABC transporter permease [Wenyingzhuangia aestuarii]|uniref:FecCD family ABC transporter permease n=1 Tax=Wenyingzhuangia aestuarii TaxID=1647582 RepID=UPI00143C1AE8|nr:iron ABC transporter permease [Wenyingzhuangia aestuarii]NJB83879.1 iron complex transport system permease protein [Wenyingzhuangia aestuarii]